MRSLADATLTPVECRVVERFVALLEDELREGLHAVWLYGSRARGEQPGDESDVDLLVISTPGDWRAQRLISGVLDDAADAEGANPALFSVHVYDPERISQRRAIRSFFIQEVDRDKIVVTGEP
jgi:predicted nucleotidyltransferase